MHTYEITIYDKVTSKIKDIYYKEFSRESDAVSYCRGRCSDKENAMFERKDKRKGKVYAKGKNLSL